MKTLKASLALILWSALAAADPAYVWVGKVAAGGAAELSALSSKVQAIPVAVNDTREGEVGGLKYLGLQIPSRAVGEVAALGLSPAPDSFATPARPVH